MKFVEKIAKTTNDAITEALIELGVTSDKVEIEIIEKETKGLLGIGSKPAKVRVTLKATPEGIANDFLERIFDSMNLKVEVSIQYSEEEKSLEIDLKGEEMGILIGKRGQTLDSLQYLVSLVVNKETDSYVKVKLDTENYRQRRKDTLEGLAKNIAYKVKKTRRSVSLEPMNPYERRIIHSVLQNEPYVETHSEGDEPFRRVVVALKKKHYNNYNKHKGNYNKSN